MAEKMFFVMVRMPQGPIVFKDEHDEVATWPTAQAAREAVQHHGVVKAFGASIFELDAADEEV
jgi:hypothetical protein